jgi:uncharacterized protein YjiS (DUF1127 family)
MYQQTVFVVYDDHIAAPSPAAEVRQSKSKKLGAARYFLNCLYIARQRKDLLELDDRLLKDIGVSRIAAGREANRSFWDIPQAMMRRGY